MTVAILTILVLFAIFATVRLSREAHSQLVNRAGFARPDGPDTGLEISQGGKLYRWEGGYIYEESPIRGDLRNAFRIAWGVSWRGVLAVLWYGPIFYVLDGAYKALVPVIPGSARVAFVDWMQAPTRPTR